MAMALVGQVPPVATTAPMGGQLEAGMWGAPMVGMEQPAMTVTLMVMTAQGEQTMEDAFATPMVGVVQRV